MNRLRVLILFALILALVAGGLPVTDTLAKWSRGSSASSRKKGKRVRRSRAWWRRHRARVRARRERAERRRLQRLAARRMGDTGLPAAANPTAVPFRSAAPGLPLAPARPALPFDFSPPHTWGAARRNGKGETTFNVHTPDGRPAGTAVIAPVSVSASDLASAAPSAKTKTVGGLPVSALRRTVIDRMVAAGGWVTNDFVREMQGRKVFVVIAQTGAPGSPSQSLTFYFAEVDGRVYSLATNTPVEFAASVAAGSEQLLASVRTAGARNLATQK